MIIFTKWPAPGAVKTRLAADVGAELASELARAFLLDLVSTASQLPVELVLAYAPRDRRADFRALLPPRWELWPQEGADLGERLGAALARSSAVDTIVIGSDSPWLGAVALCEALAALRHAESVIGPCEDGGFYLLGLRAEQEAQRRDLAALLQHIRWSTEHTCADLLAQLAGGETSHHLLPLGYDVDTEADLRRLATDLGQMPANALPATRKALAPRISERRRVAEWRARADRA